MYRLRCFGTMTLEDGEGRNLELRSQKHSALLLYLLAHRGRAFPRERLASLFWETEPRLARHSLSQALYDIRKTLPGAELDTTTGRVGAGADRVRYDGEQLEEAVRTNDLGRAVRIYGGRFAPDIENVGDADFVRWVESERQRYRRLAETALYRHVRASDDQAEWGEMCVSALRLLEMNPLSEDAHRAFMRGLWLQGDQARAVRHFEEVEAFLSRELPGGVSRETRDLVERIRSSRPTPRPSRGQRRGPPEMVGRKDEFETLKRALEDLCDRGRSGLVRIHGEAGVGKTRLLEEFRGLAALDGARVLESRCYAAESDVPYGPIVDGLHELADEFSGREGGERTYHQLGHLFPEAFDRPAESQETFAEPDAGRRRLFEEAADLVRASAEATPVVWLVEDAHWMDASSASLLHYVARRLAERPFLLVLTARTHEDVSGATRELLEDESDSLPQVVDLELGRLERDHTARLVASMLDADPDPDTVDRIHDLAGGNPFYALELLRTSVPDGVRAGREGPDVETEERITSSLKALLKRRLRGLSPDSLRIMETVAVAGRHASTLTLREATDFTADELVERGEPLYGRGLLRDAENGPEFAHDITRDFVYGNMGELQRSALHLSVGEILAKGDDAVDQATLARHFEKGGDRARAYEFALEAAKEAERRHAHEEAIQMAELALGLAGGTTKDPDLLWVLAKAEFSQSNLKPARRYLRQLRDLPASTCNDPTAANLYLARVSLELNRWSETRHWLSEAEGSIRENGGSQSLDRRLECLHLQLKTALKADEVREAARIRNEIKDLDLELETDDRSALSVALIETSLAAYELHCESPQQALRRLNDVAIRDALPPYIQMTIVLLKGVAEVALSKWDHGRVTLRRGFEVAKRHNDIIGQLYSLNNLMCVGIDEGRLDDAVDKYQQLRKLRATIPTNAAPTIAPDMNYADILINRGKYREAIEVYRGLKSRLRNDYASESWDARVIDAGMGLCLLGTGQPEEAEHIYEGMADGAEGSESIGTLSSYETVVWFRGFMGWRTDPEAARDYMQESGERMMSHHREQARRILWLTELFSRRLGLSESPHDSDDLFECEAAKRLREVGNIWYIRFSKRWLDSVERMFGTLGAGSA